MIAQDVVWFALRNALQTAFARTFDIVIAIVISSIQHNHINLKPEACSKSAAEDASGICQLYRGLVFIVVCDLQPYVDMLSNPCCT